MALFKSEKLPKAEITALKRDPGSLTKYLPPYHKWQAALQTAVHLRLDQQVKQFYQQLPTVLQDHAAKIIFYSAEKKIATLYRP